MPYGTIKVDTITFTAGGVDTSVSISGLVQNPTFTGNITSTGTISGNIIRGGTTVSGATVTGTAGQFGTLTGNTAGFTTVTGTTVTGTTATFVTVSGTTVTGTTAQFTAITGGTAGFTTVTGTTVTGTTANFVTVSGTTVTGSFGNFTSITGATVAITSGVFASGTAAAPSITFTGDVDTGVFASAANQVSFTTSGTERLRIDGTGQIEAVSLGTEAAPVFSFTTDPNTGIYSPGADQVAISTGGSGKLFVNNAGEVDVSSANARLYVTTTGTNTAIATFRNASYYYNINLDGTSGALTFYNGTERLRIDSSGRVGIGTSSPDTSLHVNSGAASRAGNFVSTDATAYSPTSYSANHRLLMRGGNATGAYNGISFTNASNCEGFIGFVQNASGYGDFVVQSYAGSYGEKLRVTSAGNVGIGTTGPSTILHAAGTVTAGASGVSNGAFDIKRSSDGLSVAGIDIDTGTSSARLSTAYSYLAFRTENTERARFDQGRLLVGTSTARTNFSNSTDDPQLQIESANGFGWASIRNSNTTGGAYVYIAKSRGTGNVIVQNNDIIGGLNFEGNDGSEFVTAAQIRTEVDGTPGANDMPGRLVFSVTQDGSASPTERLRIRNNGSSNFFASNDTVATHTSASAGTSFVNFAGYHSATNTTDGTVNFLVYSNGNVVNTNNSYGSLSDVKLKENIVDAGSQWDDLKALQVRNYNFKEATGQPTHTQIGLVAQEVELVSPGLVSESPDRDEEGNDLGTVTKSVNYSVLYMKAVKALQEAMERIETLEAKVAALESA